MAWSIKEMAIETINLIKDGSCINLGIGLPTILAEYIPPSKNIVIHSENGVLGVTGRPNQKSASPTLINAGKETISIGPGASFFDSALSFGMIRGGHIDYAILGGMEVDTNGNLANWIIPGKKITGMGGAMDLVNGPKNVFIMMKHFDKNGKAKLRKQCNLPLTGQNVVEIVVTELGIFKPQNGSFKILKLSPNIEKKDLNIDLKILN